VANTRNANTFYIDTQYSVAADALVAKQVKLLGVLVTATAAGGKVVLADHGGPTTKLDLRVATDESAVFFDFSSCPILFPNGIRPTTLTDAIVTCIIQEGTN
jgi:hypothetical protein